MNESIVLHNDPEIIAEILITAEKGIPITATPNLVVSIQHPFQIETSYSFVSLSVWRNRGKYKLNVSRKNFWERDSANRSRKFFAVGYSNR